MEVFVTYQQDTVKVNSLLKLVPEVKPTDQVIIRSSPAVLEAIPERVRLIQKDTVPPRPTYAQIRYWRKLQEQKLLIDTSRYIQPRNDVQLVSIARVERDGFGLPVRNKTSIYTDWLTVILFFVLILMATVRVSYSKYLDHLIQSIFNYPTSFRMFREKNYSFFHGAYRLEIYFYFTLSIFVFQLLNYFQINVGYSNFILFTLCLASVLIYYLLKKGIYILLGSVFEGVPETREYLFNMDNFNRIGGLFLFPFVLLIAFSPFKTPVFIVLAGVFVFMFFYFFLIQRGILILMKKQFSKFYLFLYLCSLEFLPLFLIYNIVLN